MSVTPNLATPKDVIFPPGDLYSDERPLETDLHRLQMTLLIQCLYLDVYQEKLRFFTPEAELVPHRKKLHNRLNKKSNALTKRNNAAIAWRQNCEN